jgi:hypothetical protein
MFSLTAFGNINRTYRSTSNRSHDELYAVVNGTVKLSMGHISSRIKRCKSIEPMLLAALFYGSWGGLHRCIPGTRLAYSFLESVIPILCLKFVSYSHVILEIYVLFQILCFIPSSINTLPRCTMYVLFQIFCHKFNHQSILYFDQGVHRSYIKV